MPLEDYWFDRAAEIKIVAADGSLVRRGSGFMIAPGVILTALHVVAGEHAVPRTAMFCDVRILADINAHGLDEAAYCKAELKWPAPGTSIDDAADAALVVVKEQDRTPGMIDCAALPVLDSRNACIVAGVGMPAYARTIDRTRSRAGFREIKGRIGIRLETDALLELTLDDQKHPEPAEWKGASGAVLLNARGEALVGILVHADHTGYAALKSDPSRPFMVEMLADFAQTDGFRNVVDLEVMGETAGASSAEIPQKLLQKARVLLHRLDRTSQVRQLGKVLRKGATETYRPVVLVSRMKEQDCPDVFIETLSGRLMEAFEKSRQCYWKPSDLSWRLAVSPQRAVAALKSDIIDDVVAADEAGLDAALAAGQSKRFFAVRIDSEAEEPTAEAMRDLLQWWFARSDCKDGPAILLLRIIDSLGDGEECPKAKVIYRLVDSLFTGQPPFVDLEQILEPLTRCRVKDLEDWTDLNLKAHLGNYSDALLKRFNTRIESKVGSGNPFRLRIIQEALY
jgi:hypothetical protein